MKKSLPIINKHLFQHKDMFSLSRGFFTREVNETRTEQVYFGVVADVNQDNYLRTALVHALWDDVVVIEGIQIIFNDDKYDF